MSSSSSFLSKEDFLLQQNSAIRTLLQQREREEQLKKKRQNCQRSLYPYSSTFRSASQNAGFLTQISTEVDNFINERGNVVRVNLEEKDIGIPSRLRKNIVAQRGMLFKNDFVELGFTRKKYENRDEISLVFYLTFMKSYRSAQLKINPNSLRFFNRNTVEFTPE